MILTGIYRCPFKALTGFPCPLCGTSRAFLSLLKGDIEGAFYYHPLWPLTLVTLAFIILTETGILKIKKPWNHIVPIAAGAALLICYIVRICTHTLVY
ncbi:MAG: DUF2752 domain-containing protein [Saccharofermentans sp.]|nr:DUF2752 domain-containing protein [Saccharofermentans sp.]